MQSVTLQLAHVGLICCQAPYSNSAAAVTTPDWQNKKRMAVCDGACNACCLGHAVEAMHMESKFTARVRVLFTAATLTLQLWMHCYNEQSMPSQLA